MDTFLHLVPIASDADLDQGLVYGEDDTPRATEVAEAVIRNASALSNRDESHDVSSHFATASSASSRTRYPTHSNNNNSCSPYDTNNSGNSISMSPQRVQVKLESVGSDEHERNAYLTRVKLLEAQMQRAEHALQQRLAAMARILALSDPLEQLSEYMALKLNDNERACEPAVDITAELLECAQRLPNAADSEIALLGAFVLATAAPSVETRSSIASLLPIVAAMTDSASSSCSGASFEQPVLL